ncbi:MAG: aldehyde dehydrogenase family protein [Pseudomonadota bacterium]
MPQVASTMTQTADERFREVQDHFIQGKRVADSGALAVVDPATGEHLTQAAAGSAETIDAAVAAAREAFPGWARTAPDERTRIMLRFAELCEKNEALFTQIGIRDGGLTHVVGESASYFCGLFLRYYAGWTTKITGRTLPSTALGKAPDELLAYTLREPIGVVGAITPWNYPFGMEMLKIAPVLATGCTLVLKPSEEAPTGALVLAELASEAGLPDGVFNVVQGRGEEAGAALAAHPDVNKLAFTGSTEVGRMIVRAAAADLKKISLELGGKSPVVVFPDAELEEAIPGVAMAAFALSGQNCVCGSRLFVHEDVAEDLAQGVAEFARNLTVGPGSDPANMIGPVISERQRDRIEGFFESAKAEGAIAAAGGRRHGDSGFFIEPTLFTGCRDDMRIVNEEIFGPVVAMQTFSGSDLDAVAKACNRSSYGLSGSVWTRDLGTAQQMVRLIDSGQVSVNCHAAMDPSMPFGGNKQSGWGREFGEEGLDLYLKTKAVTLSWGTARAPWG